MNDAVKNLQEELDKINNEFILNILTHESFRFLLNYVKRRYENDEKILIKDIHKKEVLSKISIDEINSKEYEYFIEIKYDPDIFIAKNNYVVKDFNTNGIIYTLSTKSKLFNTVPEIIIASVMISHDWQQIYKISYIDDINNLNTYESIINPIRKAHLA